MATNQEITKLLTDIKEVLVQHCEMAWDRLTDRVIIEKGTYTYEEELRRGSPWTYEHIEKIDEFLIALKGEEDATND